MRRLSKVRVLMLAAAVSLAALAAALAPFPAAGDPIAIGAGDETASAAAAGHVAIESRHRRKRGRRKHRSKLVRVTDNFFSPRSVRVRRRGRVTWLWKGQNTHNVTFVRVPRRASKRGTGDRDSGRFTRSFKKKGIYGYVCTNHDGMRGWIRVR